MVSLNTFFAPPAGDRRQQTWRALLLFLLYRLTLGSTLAFAFFSGTGPGHLGTTAPGLFSVTIVGYLCLVLAGGVLLKLHWPPAEQQVQLSLFIDILAITLLMHASGGLTSGLGLLIAVSIAIGGLLMRGRLSLLFAALGSLAVLSEETYSHLSGTGRQTFYTLGGLQGMTYFAVALLAHGLSRRLRETEKLARQRGLDLANMAQLNEYIIQHMNTGVLVVDRQGRIRQLNETARQHLEPANVHQGDHLERTLPALQELLRAWREDPGRAPAAFRPRPSARNLRPQFVPLGPNGAQGTLVMLEDSARLAEQAQQIKLASLGRLTASIAHEIRNPLGAISHAGQLLAESPDLAGPDRRLTAIIKSNSDRVDAIIETVLQLSRRNPAQPQFLPLGEWVARFAEEAVRAGLLAEQELEMHIDAPGLEVQADPHQLRQVLDNLCDNARKYGGVEGRPPRVHISAELPAEGRFPLLRVCDNGPGIAHQHLQSIFEPFFTTGAKGTGLGLYIAKELCEINRIDLEYEPGPETGSCFRLAFHGWRMNP
jgi:two-component system sensor histidine kinase PilS (NtrC family)